MHCASVLPNIIVIGFNRINCSRSIKSAIIETKNIVSQNTFPKLMTLVSHHVSGMTFESLSSKSRVAWRNFSPRSYDLQVFPATTICCLSSLNLARS